MSGELRCGPSSTRWTLHIRYSVSVHSTRHHTPAQHSHAVLSHSTQTCLLTCLHTRGVLSAAEVGARRTPKGATGSPQGLCHSQARRRRPYLESTHTFLPTASAACCSLSSPPILLLFFSVCLSVCPDCLSVLSVCPVCLVSVRLVLLFLQRRLRRRSGTGLGRGQARPAMPARGHG